MGEPLLGASPAAPGGYSLKSLLVIGEWKHTSRDASRWEGLSVVDFRVLYCETKCDPLAATRRRARVGVVLGKLHQRFLFPRSQSMVR